MSRRLIIRQEAEADMLEAALWYEQQRPGLGVEFTAEIHRTFNWALASPLLGRLMRRKPQVRRALARRFPYRIFYVLRTDAVVVFAVLHGARHDRRWQQRL
jgi:toxin ParE1/3/4